MSFTLNPDEGFPRLVRFLPASEFPSSTTVAMLDPAYNLLRVNRSIYEQLSDSEKGKVLKTRSIYLETTTD